MKLRSKFFTVNDKLCKVELVKEGCFYIVKVNGDIYKKTANELFALQAFIEI